MHDHGQMVNGLRERVRAALTNIFIGWLLLTGFANARLFVCLFSFYLIPWPTEMHKVRHALSLERLSEVGWGGGLSPQVPLKIDNLEVN